MQIRRATSADIPQMYQLELQAATAAHWRPAQFEALFSPEAPRRIVFVVADDPTATSLLGFLVARRLPDEWELENVVVDIRSRRQRVGAFLVRALVEEAWAAGGVDIILEVREFNLPALRLYESIGFKQEGRRRSYYRNPTEDALLYRLTLQSCDKIP